MADPTVFSIPRRRMAIAAYATSDATLLVRRDVGVINSAEATFNREVNEYKAVDVSTGECREYTADSNTTAADGTLTVEMMSTVAANLALILSGSETVVAAAAADEETLGTVAADDVVQLAYMPDPATVVLTDSAAATLVLDTNYEFVASKGGMIRILDVTGLTQPILANYTTVAQKTVSPMTNLNAYFDIAFAGGNERNSCGGEQERFYRCRVSDAQTKRLSEAADVKVAQPMSVSFTTDRDPARSYEFGVFGVTEAA